MHLEVWDCIGQCIWFTMNFGFQFVLTRHRHEVVYMYQSIFVSSSIHVLSLVLCTRQYLQFHCEELVLGLLCPGHM